MLSQTNELNHRLLEEKKAYMEIHAKLLEETRARALAELRVQELEDALLRTREDTALLSTKPQDDAKQEREVKTEILSFC